METEIIVLYCLIDDYLKAIKYEDNRQATMSSAEIMTVAIAACKFFGGNHEKSRIFFQEHGYIKNMLSKSQFNRRMHAIKPWIWQNLQSIISHVFVQCNETQEYVMDSFPVAVCQNIRISRCKIYNEKIYRGYIASKKQYFFGIRVHMVTTIKQEPVEIIFAPGAPSDAKIFKAFDLDLPENSTLYGDSMYGNYEYEELLEQNAKIKLLVQRRSNSKRPHEPWITALIDRSRKKIETTFSKITNPFPKKIHAVTAKGFELKVFSFILAYSVSML